MSRKYNSSTKPSTILAGKDLTGKVAIVTGGNGGCGYETVKALATHGAKVYAACRSMDRANEAIDKLKREKPSAQIVVAKCDLSSLNSVQQFAKEFLQKEEKLHYMICNAAIFAGSHEITEDGFESTFQVNYLSHAYMIQLLEDVIIASAPSRIVLLSSEIHRISFLTKKNISREYLSPPLGKRFVSTMAYTDSKLCMNLLTRYLARKYKDTGVTTYCVHPGIVSTNIVNNWWPARLTLFLLTPAAKSAAQGAATTIYCAIDEELASKSGDYYNDCAVYEPGSNTKDDELVDALWKLTQELLSPRLRR
ncbi:WW domain-containing oxidoreductase-like [Brevipalpus obovatus]|uniref:WW domain-containing oxidoreductase-like n=1 Tax=Brevipalpus obovatus TaxID=246614 RepID=UPI003D9EDA82